MDTSSPQPSLGTTLTSWADRPEAASSAAGRILRQFLRLLLITANEFNTNALALRSAALTYTVLLALVPILAISTAVVKELGGGDQLRKVAYGYIETLVESSNKTALPLPKTFTQTETGEKQNGSNLTDHLRSAIDQLFEYVEKTNFAALGSIAVVGILFSVILVLGNIEEAMNTIWKVTAGRSLLRKVADYMTLLILLPVSINVAFAAIAFIKNPLLAAKLDIHIPFAWMQTLLLQAVPVLIIALTFFAMYIFFPNTKVKALPALFGSTVAALLWFEVQNIYITLQIGVANYNAIYGSFATLPLLLIWLYLGWIFILAGAQLAYACQNLKTYRLIQLAAAPSLKLGAAFDIMDCLYLGFTTNRSITLEDLNSQLSHYEYSLVKEVFSQLQGAGILHTSTTDNRLLPSISLEQYDSRAVVKAILGAAAPETSGGARSLRSIEAAAEKARD